MRTAVGADDGAIGAVFRSRQIGQSANCPRRLPKHGETHPLRFDLLQSGDELLGGGTIGVPLLNFLGYDIRRAVGTSAAIGFIIGLPGAVVYALTGLGAEGLPPFSLGYVNLAAAAIIIPLTSSFAHVGVKLAHSIPRRALRFAFGIFLMVTSLRMFIDLFEAFSNS